MFVYVTILLLSSTTGVCLNKFNNALFITKGMLALPFCKLEWVLWIFGNAFFVTLLSFDSLVPPITPFFNGRTFCELINDELGRVGGAKLIFELKELELLPSKLNSDPRRSVTFLLFFRWSVNDVKESLFKIALIVGLVNFELSKVLHFSVMLVIDALLRSGKFKLDIDDLLSHFLSGCSFASFEASLCSCGASECKLLFTSTFVLALFILAKFWSEIWIDRGTSYPFVEFSLRMISSLSANNSKYFGISFDCDVSVALWEFWRNGCISRLPSELLDFQEFPEKINTKSTLYYIQSYSIVVLWVWICIRSKGRLVEKATYIDDLYKENLPELLWFWFSSAK